VIRRYCVLLFNLQLLPMFFSDENNTFMLTTCSLTAELLATLYFPPRVLFHTQPHRKKKLLRSPNIQIAKDNIRTSRATHSKHTITLIESEKMLPSRHRILGLWPHLTSKNRFLLSTTLIEKL